jgi:hypothetical protein
LPFDLCHLPFDLLVRERTGQNSKFKGQTARGEGAGFMGGRVNGIATAADFRKLAEAAAFEEPARVVLPQSGLGVVLRRPTKFYWALRRSEWLPELREKLDLVGVGVKPELTAEETLLLVREDRQMLNEAFVDPAPSLNPGLAQFDPNWLPKEDAEFILRYLRGQVLANGQDLDAFRQSEQRHPAGSGTDGALVREDPERDVIPRRCGMAS